MTVTADIRRMLALKAKGEIERRQGLYQPKLPITLSPEQEAFVSDPSKRKIARCGRRGGKSMSLAVYFIRAMLNKSKARCLYLTLTREQSREILWEPIIYLLRTAGIRHTASKSELKITLWNGSFVRLFGCDSDKAKNRLLGQPWDLVAVDECGYVSEVDELVTRVIMPSLTDYDGTLCLTSSPPTVFQGLFWEADQGSLKKYWSQHTWTIAQNPFYAGRWERVLDDVIKTQFGGNSDHPTYMREYLGKWVAESSDRIYPFSKNNVMEHSKNNPQAASWTVIGLDLGFKDPNAIVVLRVHEDSREVEELYTWSQAGLNVDQIAGQLKSLEIDYKPLAIIADTGGYGKGITEELRHRYGMQITAADKRDKGFYQEIVKADMLSGYCKFYKDSLTVAEMQMLVRDPKTGQEDERCANHLCDAYLYAYRFIYNRHLKHFKAPATEEERMLEQLTHSVNTQIRNIEEEKEQWGVL